MPGFSRRQVKLTNSLGLHLRAANRLVQLAQQFQSEVRVSCDGHSGNGKSILHLMTLGAVCGSRLEIEIIGSDAEKASSELCALIENGFHKDEVAEMNVAASETEVDTIYELNRS